MSRHPKSVLSRLHASLVADVARTAAQVAFTKLCERHPPLTRFPSAIAAAAYVADPGEPSLDRNVVLAALVTASHRHTPVASLATTLVTLGLWPGITSLFSQLRRRLPDDDERLSQITLHFAEHVARVEPARVPKLAATLILDTRRSLVAELDRQDLDPGMLTEFDGDEADVAADVDVQTLDAWVRSVVGADAGPVLARVVGRTPFAEIARDVGMTEEAARKRIARALDRLRADLTA